MPKGHKPLGIGSSTMSTKSPTSTLGFTWNHFCQDCKSGKYSRVHLFQNWVAMYCTYRHRFRYTSAVSKFPHGNEATPSIANRWFGVKTSQSLTWLCDRTLIDDAFTLAEHGMEDFVRECHVMKEQRQQYLTNTPYEPLPHAAMVGSKGRVELPINTSALCSRAHLSLVQLTKAPGYLCLCTDEVRPIVTVDPRLETKRMKAFMKESASKLLRTSMWMARDLKHVTI